MLRMNCSKKANQHSTRNWTRTLTWPRLGSRRRRREQNSHLPQRAEVWEPSCLTSLSGIPARNWKHSMLQGRLFLLLGMHQQMVKLIYVKFYKKEYVSALYFYNHFFTTVIFIFIILQLFCFFLILYTLLLLLLSTKETNKLTHQYFKSE